MTKSKHGGDVYSRPVRYDFSSNINPFGMPQSVKNALIDHIDDLARYPDVNCSALKKAIGKYEQIDEENIVCGNGAADLIYRIVQTIKPRKALLTAPTFSEYEKALRSVDCGIVYHYLNENNGFKLDKNILAEMNGIDMIFLCDPNNPTGNVIDRNLMSSIIHKCIENNIYLVIDECFMDFVADSNKYRTTPADENVIILKAFTKIYAMAGLRLGYLLCKNENLIQHIENCGQCWSVSVPAQIAGVTAVKEKEYIKKTVKLVSEERRYLTNSLKKIGFKVYPSEANFILFKCGLSLDEILIKEGVAIRNCSDYIGLEEGYFRIAVRTHYENEILINAAERAVKK